MKIGTKSVLFGAHQFIIHPLFVALAWYKLWGFNDVDDPYLGKVNLKNWRLWLAFFVHDLGYLGRPNMDGPEGEEHVFWGAHWLANRLDGPKEQRPFAWGYRKNNGLFQSVWLGPWGQFSLHHSRFVSKQRGKPFSMLCVADKLAAALEPRRLYLPRVILSGEIVEFMERAQEARKGQGKYAGEPAELQYDVTTILGWYTAMSTYCRNWAYEHMDGKKDTWTQP